MVSSDLFARAPVLKKVMQRAERAEAGVLRLTTEIERLREQRDALQQKVHLCAAYDKLEADNERLRAALERIEAMSERPKCICGRPTGTAAIKACAFKALEQEQDGE